VVAVITQPDRPKGRKLRVAACPVKRYADEHGMRVIHPLRLSDPEAVDAIRDLSPDLIVVAAYGQYIPSSVLAIPRREAINFHPSMLPKYRGAAPIQMAIAEGEAVTGVSIIYVAKETDAGDMILQEVVPIERDDTSVTLAERLGQRGAGLMLQAIDLIRAGRAPRIAQDHAAATYVPKLTKEDGRIPWARDAETIRNRIRGFTPWPGCFCRLAPDRDETLRVWGAEVQPGGGEPGTVLACTGSGPLVATGQDALILTEVQPTGKRRMAGSAYLNGYGLARGHRFG
jgi:methionyl-tRNA formyltransferase